MTWAMNKLDLGGRHVVETLMRLLNERGYSFATTTELEMCRGLQSPSSPNKTLGQHLRSPIR